MIHTIEGIYPKDKKENYCRILALSKNRVLTQTNKDIKIWMTEPPYSFIYQIPSKSYRPALYFAPDTDSLLVGDYTLLYINNLKQTVTTIKDVIQYKKAASIYKVKENSFLVGSSQLSYVKDISKPTIKKKFIIQMIILLLRLCH